LAGLDSELAGLVLLSAGTLGVSIGFCLIGCCCNVGALAAMVPNNMVGVVTEPEYISIAAGIEKLYSLGESHFIPAIEIEKKKYNWNQLTHQIWDLIK